VLAGLAGLVIGCASGSSDATRSTDPVVRRAEAEVQRQLSSATGYDGPRQGPRARRTGSIVFVASDLTNGGVAGVAEGVRQAARAIGWRLVVLDGDARVAGRRQALRRALALRPSGIVLGGFDASEQPAALRRAARSGLPVVGWHAGPTAGPDPGSGLFTNVTSDPLAVSRLAARYAIADAGGKAGVVIFTDPRFRIALEKADAIRAEVGRCVQCAVLGLEHVPIAGAQQRMPSLVSALLQRYGRRLTHLLAINGSYFAGSRVALIDAGRQGDQPPFAVAAGDGDASEFQRIRSADYQKASVAEPLYLQGWQLVDELNRARAGRPASGYLAPPHLITRSNVPAGGGYDPAAPYRENFRRIWGG